MLEDISANFNFEPQVYRTRSLVIAHVSWSVCLPVPVSVSPSVMVFLKNHLKDFSKILHECKKCRNECRKVTEPDF